jgi:hypothetical protein
MQNLEAEPTDIKEECILLLPYPETKREKYLIENMDDSIKKRFIWRPSGKELIYLV